MSSTRLKMDYKMVKNASLIQLVVLSHSDGDVKCNVKQSLHRKIEGEQAHTVRTLLLQSG